MRDRVTVMVLQEKRLDRARRGCRRWGRLRENHLLRKGLWHICFVIEFVRIKIRREKKSGMIEDASTR